MVSLQPFPRALADAHPSGPQAPAPPALAEVGGRQLPPALPLHTQDTCPAALCRKQWRSTRDAHDKAGATRVMPTTKLLSSFQNNREVSLGCFVVTNLKLTKVPFLLRVTCSSLTGVRSWYAQENCSFWPQCGPAPHQRACVGVCVYTHTHNHTGKSPQNRPLFLVHSPGSFPPGP